MPRVTPAGIVLAGGSASRLSGMDKPMLDVGGIPLLRRVVSALSVADPVVVVGPERPGVPDVRWAREDPPGGGPVAALAAGLATLPADFAGPVVLLAGDLPAITQSTVDKLLAALGEADGAVLADSGGNRQWLLGAWRAGALRAALPPNPVGASVRRTLGGLSIVDVPAAPGEGADIDTPEDLDRFRAGG
jgi:molybdopterin-guanine dinucleotide biosynthesis protein A